VLANSPDLTYLHVQKSEAVQDANKDDILEDTWFQLRDGIIQRIWDGYGCTRKEAWNWSSSVWVSCDFVDKRLHYHWVRLFHKLINQIKLGICLVPADAILLWKRRKHVVVINWRRRNQWHDLLYLSTLFAVRRKTLQFLSDFTRPWNEKSERPWI